VRKTNPSVWNKKRKGGWQGSGEEGKEGGFESRDVYFSFCFVLLAAGILFFMFTLIPRYLIRRP